MSHALLLLCNRCLDHFNLFCPLKYSPSSWIYFWAGQSIFGSTVQTLQRGHHSDNDKQEIQGHFLNCLPFQIDDIWAWQTEHSCRRVCVCGKSGQYEEYCVTMPFSDSKPSVTTRALWVGAIQGIFQNKCYLCIFSWKSCGVNSRTVTGKFYKKKILNKLKN